MMAMKLEYIPVLIVMVCLLSAGCTQPGRSASGKNLSTGDVSIEQAPDEEQVTAGDDLGALIQDVFEENKTAKKSSFSASDFLLDMPADEQPFDDMGELTE